MFFLLDWRYVSHLVCGWVLHLLGQHGCPGCLTVSWDLSFSPEVELFSMALGCSKVRPKAFGGPTAHVSSQLVRFHQDQGIGFKEAPVSFALQIENCYVFDRPLSALYGSSVWHSCPSTFGFVQALGELRCAKQAFLSICTMAKRPFCLLTVGIIKA